MRPASPPAPTYRLLFDLDDVIANCAPALMRLLERHTGRHVDFETVNDYYRLSDQYGIGADEFLRIIAEDPDWLGNLEPIPGSIEALRGFMREGYEVILVTARGYRDDAEAITRNWLRRHRVPHDRLIVVPHGASKSESYRKVGDHFLALFDDSAHNLDDAAASGLVDATVCIERPWNRSWRGGDESWRFSSLASAARALSERFAEMAGMRHTEYLATVGY